uniref:PRA1 family protein n=1 Tax=Macrostomum lignano TaxID=282301 RepID=A0A1I8IMU2_9PLAT
LTLLFIAVLLVLEIAWHLISLPVLALLLLPWSLLQHLPEKISQLKDCSDRSVSVRLLAAVSAIDWTVALLISGALICLLHRLGCDLLPLACDSNKKLPGQLPPLPPPPPTSIRRRQLCCPPFTSRSTSSSLPFGLTDAALRLTPLFADLNLVASDLAAGLVLLRRQQRLRQRSELSEGSKRVLDYMSGRPIYSATRFFNLANPTDKIEIELALYCAKLILVAEACCCHGNRSVTGAVRHSLNRQGVSDARF